MAKVKLTYKENKSYFSEIAKEYKDEIEAIIEDTTQNIETEATNNVRRDTSFLASSINAEYKDLEGSVFVRKDYAPYVEFGTGGLVDVPSGLEDYAIQFKGNNIKQVNLPARPFLFPAWKANSIKMLERLKVLINGSK